LPPSRAAADAYAKRWTLFAAHSGALLDSVTPELCPEGSAPMSWKMV
jgi:hypothetical protein